MAKKIKKSNPLDKLIPPYGILKDQISEDNKAANELNTHIKKLMAEQGLDEKEVGGYIAKYSVRESEYFDTEELLEFCHKHKELAGCIKTQEYVDMDELENLMYNKKVPKKILLKMDKLRKKSSTAYLNISKAKEK